MHEIQIPEPMMNVIMHPITSIETNVNWNSGINGFFRPQRGIRQGDPISPYMFVICMDKLTHLIVEEITNKKWKGVNLGNQGIMMSQLMFANDLLISGEATESQMIYMMERLKKFCRMSGHDISHERTSILFSNNVNRSIQNKLQHISKFRITKRFGRYLGVPLSGKKLKKNDFQYIVDQVATRLNGWKKNSLALVGRITLAKSVIEAIPLYPLMINSLQKTCIEEIHRLQRRFVWGDSAEKKQIHVVALEVVTTPKQLGGVGLRDLNVLNQACLMILDWNLHHKADDFWCSVLRKKYKILDGNDCPKSRATDSILWKDVASIICQR